VVFDTGRPDGAGAVQEGGGTYRMEARSLVLLAG
jgi:hypothetical protein